MITKRIIPCLDVKDGRVVKGVNFQGLSDVNSPVELAEYYTKNGADEMVFYDITASAEGRKLFTEVRCRQGQREFRCNPEPGADPAGGGKIRKPVRGPVRGCGSGGRNLSGLRQGRPKEHGHGCGGMDSRRCGERRRRSGTQLHRYRRRDGGNSD